MMITFSSSATGGGGLAGFFRTHGEKSALSVKFIPDPLHLTCETNLANLHFRNHTKLEISFKDGRIQGVKKTLKFYFVLFSS